MPGRARRPSSARSARGRARRSPRAASRRGARAARSRARSRFRAPAPRAAGRCRCRSAPRRARSCRGRCGPAVPSVRPARRSSGTGCDRARRPRRPRRRRSCGSRAASARRGRRATTGGSARRGARPRARPRPRTRRSAARAAAARRRRRAPVVSTTSPPISRASRSARARTSSSGSCSIRSTGTSRERPLGVEVEQQRPLERGERELVGPERALERMAAQPADELGAADRRSPPAGRRAACRPRTRRGRRRRRGCPGRAARRRTRRGCPSRGRRGAAAPCGRATRDELARARGRSVKPTVRKFDWCDAQQQRGLGPDRRLVVGGARAVRRADLDEARARAREHVGDAEAVADLDQLAARDDHLAALGERGEREQQRGGVVVDDERVLGARRAGAASRARWSCREPRSPVGEVVLEVRVARRDLATRLERGRRRAARGRGSCAGRRRSR